ncbi:MAG TPA: hypothetical protein VFG31_01765 [Conexibacter sp.]|nr:hypothetical protein [Conexibacter sp.]
MRVSREGAKRSRRGKAIDLQTIVRNAKRRGTAIVYDNDDDLRAVPQNNVAYKRYGGFSGERALERAIARAGGRSLSR